MKSSFLAGLKNRAFPRPAIALIGRGVNPNRALASAFCQSKDTSRATLSPRFSTVTTVPFSSTSIPTGINAGALNRLTSSRACIAISLAPLAISLALSLFLFALHPKMTVARKARNATAADMTEIQSAVSIKPSPSLGAQ
jgi:hypothetical protein